MVETIEKNKKDNHAFSTGYVATCVKYYRYLLVIGFSI